MPVFTFSGKTNSGEKFRENARPEQRIVSLCAAARAHHARSIREKGKEFSLPTSEAPRSRRRNRGILPAVLRHDRCRLAAGAVSRNSSRQPGESQFPEDAHRRPHHRRRRFDASQCDAPVPKCSTT